MTDQILPFIIVGAVAIIAISSVIVAAAIDRRRTAEYAAWCQARRLRFAHEIPGEEERHVESCPLFSEGRARRWRFSISGDRDGVAYTMFEYRYTTGSGRSSRTHTVSAILWRMERELPQFSLTPEGFLDRVAAFFGGQDIDFADSPAFSKARRLQGSNESAVRALFAPRLLEATSSIGQESVSGGGHELFWWQDGQLPAPQDLDEFLAAGDRIRKLFEQAN